MSPRSHLLAIVLGCVLSLLAINQVLLLWATKTLDQEVASQRDLYLLQSLHTAVDNYSTIGLELEQMDALQRLIERERSSFAEVLAIDIFAANGTLLYSTDPHTRGSRVPNTWLQHLAQKEAWHIDNPSQRQMGIRFENDLGQAAGGIALTIATTSPSKVLDQWKRMGQHIMAWLLVAILACTAACIGVLWGLRHLLQPFARITPLLQQDSPLSGSANILEQAARHTRLRWLAQTRQNQERLRQLQEIDHAG